jgi:flagellar hook-basal body complex protein FliE
MAPGSATRSAAIDNLQQLQSDLERPRHQGGHRRPAGHPHATIASTRASVTLELIAAVRNKGVDAFNEIMRMQA